MAASPRLPVRLDGRPYYTIEPNAAGWTITICRRSGLVETLDVDTRPEASRLTRRLASSGLIGFVADGEPQDRAPYERPRRGLRP